MATPSLGEGGITRQQYWRLVDEGVIGPDDRVELLEGVIVAMSPQNPPHAFAVAALDRRLHAAAGPDAVVRVQMPLDVSDCSTPEPDLAVVSGRETDYAAVHPTTALLVVEVADTTLLQDRLTKGPMYAAAGLPEYWLVNLRQRCVEVQRQPDREARRYTTSQVYRAGERLETAVFPGLSILVDEVLPPG